MTTVPSLPALLHATRTLAWLGYSRLGYLQLVSSTTCCRACSSTDARENRPEPLP